MIGVIVLNPLRASDFGQPQGIILTVFVTEGLAGTTIWLTEAAARKLINDLTAALARPEVP